MHELGITRAVVKCATEQSGGRKVRRVVFEVGEQSALCAEAVRFCFDLCAEGTPVEGARLEIRAIPGWELKVTELEVV